MKKNVIVILLLLYNCYVFATTNVYIQSSKQTASEVSYAVTDIKELLQQANATIVTTKDSANWIIQYAWTENEAIATTRYEAATKEAHAFSINSTIENSQYIISINSRTPKGVANGLYYFLQDKLGFAFYHPKEIEIPDLSQFPLDTFTEINTPRFDKIGFHIHAMHPLEITEALLNEQTPNGNQIVKEYIDWLCRNGQNYFEFNLLRSMQLETWIPYMKAIVDYAHERGIICGADMSFHMIQQRAFQLYKKFPASFRKKENQILENITTLMQINWDVWNVEFATTEFTHKDQDKLYQQQKFLFDNLAKYKVKLTSRKHVVKDENLLSGTKSMKKTITDMDSAYALFVHTVMFYGLNDTATPVYRNKDFSHLRNLLVESKDYRDTWYFPESAYWITFDNSVPMFLTPYLSARLDDILYCDSLGINGHLTFSSGWEWNYWSIDWSIARWCWNTATKPTPFQFIKPLVKKDVMVEFIEKANKLQQYYIKDKQLIKVLTAQTITDEIKGKLNIEFHPRPEFAYKYIMNKATAEELAFLQQKYIVNLDSFVQAYRLLKSRYTFDSNTEITNEFVRSLDITALRAEHRKNTLSYLIMYRLNKLNKTSTDLTVYSNNAASVRNEALAIVHQQEKKYRYPTNLLATARKSKTVYDFGYLFPVANLHFWQREELQMQHNKWKFWYQNIWDVLKIIGVKK